MTYQPAPLSDEELEQHIVDCGKHFLKAHALGDMPLAREWLAKQSEAVASRTPAQVARMEACYFSADAERTQQESFGRAAAA